MTTARKADTLVHEPLVSICIPNLEMARYLPAAIESALAQTWPLLEVLVVDNASRDDSWAIAQRYADQDARVRCIRNERTLRVAANWNVGLREAQGRYVNFLSADDELAPDFALRCMELFRAEPDLGYVFTHTSTLDEMGRESVSEPFFETSGIIEGLAEARLNLIGQHNGPSEMLIHRGHLLEIGGFCERYDWAIDVKAKLELDLRWDVGYRREALCRYRVHGENCSAHALRTKIGVMELYRLKLEILESLPPGAKHLAELQDAMLRNLTVLCEANALRALKGGDPQLAHEYRHLGRSFEPARPESRSSRSRVAAAHLARAPFPLPAGSIPWAGVCAHQ